MLIIDILPFMGATLGARNVEPKGVAPCVRVVVA